MVENDLKYVQRLKAANLIQGPFPELGTDLVADFGKADQMAVFRESEPFGTVLILNVLEHTFEFVGCGDVAVHTLPGGSCALPGPARGAVG